MPVPTSCHRPRLTGRMGPGTCSEVPGRAVLDAVVAQCCQGLHHPFSSSFPCPHSPILPPSPRRKGGSGPQRSLSVEDIGAPGQLRAVGRVVEVFPDGTSQLELQRPPHGAFGFSITSGHGRPDTGIVGSSQSFGSWWLSSHPRGKLRHGWRGLLIAAEPQRGDVGGGVLPCVALATHNPVSISTWLGTHSPCQRLFIIGLFLCSPWALTHPVPSAGVYVQEMADAGTAKLYAGLLGVGDEILQVNGAAVSGLGLARIRELLLQADTLSLRVLRHRPAPR